MSSRVVHRVRCRKQDNKQVWADVKVVDAITVRGTDGKEKSIWVKAEACSPFIVDNTGGENSAGSSLNASRASHMVLASSPDDPNQKMYLEILDALAIVNITRHSQVNEAGAFDSLENTFGVSDAAIDGAGEITLVFPDSRAVRLIGDSTGLGLASGIPENASRAGHVSIATENGNTDDKTSGILLDDPVPPQKMAWVAVVKPDALQVRVTGGAVITIYIPRGAQDEIDSTVMTTDPFTHEPCPPDNTDPNLYVTFPLDGDPNAPCVGCNVHIPKIGDVVRPIDQGPLWWIERVSPSFQPWFWYADLNTPQAFSYFGTPGRLGSWGWRGFVLWNNYPVIWILSKNNALVPMGQFGSPSLDLCAREGDWDFSFPPVPSAPFLAPGRPAGSTVQFPFSGLSFVGAGDLSVENGEQTNASGIAPQQGGPFGPFGILQMTHPPLGPLPDAVPYGPIIPGSDIWDGRPNIWQLTGTLQPNRADRTKPWEPFTNPYLPPSAKDAETAAKLFEQNWNLVANGHNEFIQSYVPDGRATTGYPGAGQPPDWQWAIAWFDGSVGPPTDFRASFQNGLPPGLVTRAFPLEVYAPATAWTLRVDQLRPDWWDTTHLEFYNNPINAFLPLVDPPFLWSNDPWTGTAHGQGNPETGP